MDPSWEDDPENSYRGAKAIVTSALQGGFGWRVSRTPHRTDLSSTAGVADETDAGGAARGAGDGSRPRRAIPEYGVEGDVYVTAPVLRSLKTIRS